LNILATTACHNGIINYCTQPLKRVLECSFSPCFVLKRWEVWKQIANINLLWFFKNPPSKYTVELQLYYVHVQVKLNNITSKNSLFSSQGI